jgi:hypothetical protein
MTIPLPFPGWSVTLAPGCSYRDNPLGRDYDRYKLEWDAPGFQELLLKQEFNPARIWHDGRVLEVQPIWYICPRCLAFPAAVIDGLPAETYFHDRLQGRLVGNAFGMARVYYRRLEALADLAKCDLVVGVAHSHKGTVKMLASAVLHGDRESLPVLIAALEHEGSPLAEQVKECCSAKGQRHGLHSRMRLRESPRP